MPARYHFVTEMVMTSDPAEVERVLQDVGQWPSWWQWSRRIVQVNDAPNGEVGAKYHNQVDTPARYGLTYQTEIVERSANMIRLRSTGDLEGTGLFEHEATHGGGVHLRFTWLVQTNRWWMNVIATVARAVFARNHARLMTDFAHGLAAASDGELLSVSHTTLTPKDPDFFRLPTKE